MRNTTSVIVALPQRLVVITVLYLKQPSGISMATWATSYHRWDLTFYHNRGTLLGSWFIRGEYWSPLSGRSHGLLDC